jgi:transcriptional regulator with XRE-family HTH domain
MSLGENIRQYRKSLKMTQEELAKKMKVIQPNVYRWEKDLVTPSIDTIKKMAKILNVSVDGLIFSDDERKKLRITNKELLERLKDIENFNDEDRQTLIRLIDAFKAKNGAK